MSDHPTPNSEPRTTTLIRALLFAVVLCITAATIISLKRMTNEGPLTPEHLAARDSVRNIAHPDTTESPDLTPPPAVTTTPDATTNYVVDTLTTTDERTPADAGYEDGYYAGITDGVSGDERASYDETSQFPEAHQRINYTDAYRRGYAQGFQDGQEGKQFSVIPQDDEEDDRYAGNDEELDDPTPPHTEKAPAKQSTEKPTTTHHTEKSTHHTEKATHHSSTTTHHSSKSTKKSSKHSTHR